LGAGAAAHDGCAGPSVRHVPQVVRASSSYG
jgi:hypothetical protein